MRRIFWMVRGAGVVMHAPLVLGAMLFVSPVWALSGGAALFAATVWRVQRLMREGRRERWMTWLVDMPVFAHWSASVLSLFVVFPCFAAFAVLLRAAGFFAAPLFTVVASAALASYVVSLAMAVYGSSLRRRWVRVVRVDIPIVGLSPEFDGYRIVQISDLHIGNFDTKKRGLEWAEQVNRLEPDLVAVTGDLVTTGTAFYADVADVLGVVRARDGVFVSLGNHDQWDADQLTRLIETQGPRVLRNAWTSVRRGGAELVVAGIDDRMTGKDDLEKTLAGRPPRTPTVLLSHYPDFFAEAASRRVDLVLAGHTHGGQVAVPFMARRASLSTIARQMSHGLHVREASRLYVHAGLGTTGPPFRLGIPPEIAVLTLRSR